VVQRGGRISCCCSKKNVKRSALRWWDENKHRVNEPRHLIGRTQFLGAYKKHLMGEDVVQARGRKRRFTEEEKKTLGERLTEAQSLGLRITHQLAAVESLHLQNQSYPHDEAKRQRSLGQRQAQLLVGALVQEGKIPSRGSGRREERMRIFKEQPEHTADYARLLFWQAALLRIQEDLANGKECGEWTLPPGGVPSRVHSSSFVNASTGENDVLGVRRHQAIYKYGQKEDRALFPVDTSVWWCFDEKPNTLRGSFHGIEGQSTSWTLGVLVSMAGELPILQILLPSEDGKVPGTIQKTFAQLSKRSDAVGEMARATIIDVSANGFQTKQTFFRFMEKALPLMRCTRRRPGALTLDSASSHLDRKTLKMCRLYGLHVIAEPSASSGYLQSLDNGANAEIERRTNAAIHGWALGEGFDKKTLPDVKRLELLLEAVHHLKLSPSLIRAAWAKVGWSGGWFRPLRAFSVDTYRRGAAYRQDHHPAPSSKLLQSLFAPSNLIQPFGSPHPLPAAAPATLPLRRLGSSSSSSSPSSSAASSTSSSSSASTLRATPVSSPHPAATGSLTRYILRRTPKPLVAGSVRLLCYESSGKMQKRIASYDALITAAESDATAMVDDDDDDHARPDRYDTSLGGSLTSEQATRRFEEATARKKIVKARKRAAANKREEGERREAPLRQALEAAVDASGTPTWPVDKRERRPTVEVIRAFLSLKGVSVASYGVKRDDLVTLALAQCSPP
jgi:hypothetical protein